SFRSRARCYQRLGLAATALALRFTKVGGERNKNDVTPSFIPSSFGKRRHWAMLGESPCFAS
ncbi:MAG: hypothetical protein L7T24_03820, partial [Luminiphilus sp.]|nr:hypothetical protein [Luminiphilus sp.]